VGQGEAIVARTGPQSGVLVDAGPSPSAVDGCLDALGIRTLASIVLTGGTSAAVGGLPGALHGRTVAEIDAVAQLAADADVRVRGWAAASHVAAASTKAGVIHVAGNVTWRVVAEPASARVVSVDVAGVSVVVAGDLSAADETDLVSTVGSLQLPVASLHADVLVVPHHGAALDAAFLAAVHPRVAVVSVGRGNSEHDPTASVLNALSVRAVRVIRTDKVGNIAIVVKSGNLLVVAPHGSHH
jgi:competence protein ComEC